ACAVGADGRVAPPLPEPAERRVLGPGALGRQAHGRAGVCLGAGAVEPHATEEATHMKFGLFYELSVPRPWTRESAGTWAKGRRSGSGGGGATRDRGSHAHEIRTLLRAVRAASVDPRVGAL